MPFRIDQPTIIEAAGNKPKRIEEYIGRVNSSTEAVSIARMCSPTGWAAHARSMWVSRKWVAYLRP